MLRYKTQSRPGLVTLYDIRPGNRVGPFLLLQPRNPHRADGPESPMHRSGSNWTYKCILCNNRSLPICIQSVNNNRRMAPGVRPKIEDGHGYGCGMAVNNAVRHSKLKHLTKQQQTGIEQCYVGPAVFSACRQAHANRHYQKWQNERDEMSSSVKPARTSCDSRVQLTAVPGRCRCSQPPRRQTVCRVLTSCLCRLTAAPCSMMCLSLTALRRPHGYNVLTRRRQPPRPLASRCQSPVTAPPSTHHSPALMTSARQRAASLVHSLNEQRNALHHHHYHH